MNSIKEAWAIYEERVLPKGLNKKQIAQSRTTFYTGACCLFHISVKETIDKNLQSVIDTLANLEEEVNEFTREIEENFKCADKDSA